jgi:hypothetical protein
MALYSDCLDLPDASDSIGTKHKSDDPGNEVIVFSALLRIIKIPAISARRITALHAAAPDLAPRSLPIVMTPGTTSFQVRTTRTTVKTTISHQGYIRSDSLHRFHYPLPGNEITGHGVVGMERRVNTHQVVRFRLALPDLHKATDTVECRGIRYLDSFLIMRLLSRLNVFWQ